MTERVMLVTPKRAFDFSALATGQSLTIAAADRIDLVPWREVTVQIDVHNHTLAGGSGTIAVQVFNQSVTSEEPAVIFEESFPFVAVVLGSTTPSPGYLCL